MRLVLVFIQHQMKQCHFSRVQGECLDCSQALVCLNLRAKENNKLNRFSSIKHRRVLCLVYSRDLGYSYPNRTRFNLLKIGKRAQTFPKTWLSLSKTTSLQWISFSTCSHPPKINRSQRKMQEMLDFQIHMRQVNTRITNQAFWTCFRAWASYQVPHSQFKTQHNQNKSQQIAWSNKTHNLALLLSTSWVS